MSPFEWAGKSVWEEMDLDPMCAFKEKPFPSERKCVWLVQCQSAEQYIFGAWNILTKIPCLARWDYDKVPWLHHYYCRAGFLFISLFRLTFVTLLNSNARLLPDSAVLLVCAGLCKSKRMRGGNMVGSGWRGWDGGQSMAPKHRRCCVAKCARVLQFFGGIASDTELWLLILSLWQITACFSAGLALAPAAAPPRSWRGWSRASAVTRWRGKVWASPMARAEGAARCLRAWKTFLSSFRKLLYLQLTGKG